MFTQCPKCKKVFTLTAEELRNEGSIMNCPDCNSNFDVLESLSDKRPNVKPGRYQALDDDIKGLQSTSGNSSLLQEMLEEQNTSFKPHDQETLLVHHDTTYNNLRSRKAPTFEAAPYFKRQGQSVNRNQNHSSTSSATAWGLALLAVLVLLFTQIYYFENSRLLNDKRVRVILVKVCELLDCKLPPYQNKEELAIVQGSLEPVSENIYQLKAVFSNKSPFPQPYPPFKLGLLTFNGEVLTSRTFYPNEYLPDNSENTLIPGNEMVEISLEIATPEIKIGGYTIDLL